VSDPACLLDEGVDGFGKGRSTRRGCRGTARSVDRIIAPASAAAGVGLDATADLVDRPLSERYCIESVERQRRSGKGPGVSIAVAPERPIVATAIWSQHPSGLASSQSVTTIPGTALQDI
jgi:hypothetical protein